MADIETVFKAYDIRGTYPDQLDAGLCRQVGAAFAKLMRDEEGAERILICRDMRESGVELTKALAEGAVSQGIDVLDLGMGSTDLLYFAAGKLHQPGVMLTASHNPARYNGIKLCRPGARPVGVESGLADIKKMVITGEPAPTADKGSISADDMLGAFVSHVHSFVDPSLLRPIKVVADTANGMGGFVAPEVFAGLPFEVEFLFQELDGNFPNHPADPIQPENLKDLQARVLETGADIGLAFDGDADRVFLVDDQAQPVSGSITTAMVAKSMLEKYANAHVVYNVVCSKTVREVIAETDGCGVRSRVGHSYIKGLMAENDAVFGGEHSGHYYFRGNYFADSGIIAAMIVLEMMSAGDQPLSEMRRPFERYVASGEINSVIADPLAAIEHVSSKFPEDRQDRLDGLTVDNGDWWFSLRPSNTEPLLRLNLEASSKEDCDVHVGEILSLVKAV